MTAPTPRAAWLLRAGLALLPMALPSLALPQEAQGLQIDVSGLPQLGQQWRDENPYRGNATAVKVGEAAFTQACGRCHVLATSGGIGPDLRSLDAYCLKIADAQIRSACMKDQDHYFRKTVLEGKVIVGVTHMPAWKGLLSQEALWAIRTYIESRRPGCCP